MRILADENIPGIAVNELNKRGHNVVWVRIEKPGIEDPAILEWAQAENRLLITLDKDFGEWPLLEIFLHGAAWCFSG